MGLRRLRAANVEQVDERQVAAARAATDSGPNLAANNAGGNCPDPTEFWGQSYGNEDGKGPGAGGPVQHRHLDPARRADGRAQLGRLQHRLHRRHAADPGPHPLHASSTAAPHADMVRVERRWSFAVDPALDQPGAGDADLRPAPFATAPTTRRSTRTPATRLVTAGVGESIVPGSAWSATHQWVAINASSTNAGVLILRDPPSTSAGQPQASTTTAPPGSNNTGITLDRPAPDGGWRRSPRPSTSASTTRPPGRPARARPTRAAAGCAPATVADQRGAADRLGRAPATPSRAKPSPPRRGPGKTRPAPSPTSGRAALGENLRSDRRGDRNHLHGDRRRRRPLAEGDGDGDRARRRNRLGLEQQRRHDQRHRLRGQRQRPATRPPTPASRPARSSGGSCRSTTADLAGRIPAPGAGLRRIRGQRLPRRRAPTRCRARTAASPSSKTKPTRAARTSSSGSPGRRRRGRLLRLRLPRQHRRGRGPGRPLAGTLRDRSQSADTAPKSKSKSNSRAAAGIDPAAAARPNRHPANRAKKTSSSRSNRSTRTTGRRK